MRRCSATIPTSIASPSVPAGKKAKISADGVIDFPVGTVLVKSFGWTDVNEGHPVETRLLIRRARGWVALPYIWDADGKDATLALGRTPRAGELQEPRWRSP